MSKHLTPAAAPSRPGQIRYPHSASGSALLSEADWGEVARALGLSVREQQTVRGVFDNRTERALAVDLGIAACTVHTHLERLYRKLGVTTRVQLVLRVMAVLLAMPVKE
jgi:DNA-binding CsgD family transcriptional regulator